MTPGPLQILLIVLIVFLIFGAGKLPQVMGDLAKGVKNFKKGLSDEEETQKISDQSAETSALKSENKEKEEEK